MEMSICFFTSYYLLIGMCECDQAIFQTLRDIILDKLLAFKNLEDIVQTRRIFHLEKS